MKRSDAKKVAETITNQQLVEMFIEAKSKIKDWNAVSIINPILSKGSAWNVLAAKFDVNKKYHILAKINMIREYGEYLPEDLKPVKPIKPKFEIKSNQEPNFDNPIYNQWQAAEL